MTTEFNTATPMDINEYKIDDVAGLITYRTPGLPSPAVRLKYVKMLYDVLGLTLTPDAALAAIAEPQSLMALSIAGGGKTTWSQVKAVLQKLIRPARKPPRSNPNKKINGDKILCLVYNKHNVKDMKDRHKQLVNRMYLANIKGLEIDDEINASTLHAFCDFWRREYVLKFDLLNCRLLEEAETVPTMKRAIKLACKVLHDDNSDEISPEKCVALYTLKMERMCKDISELSDSDKYQELELSDDVIALIFEKYEAVKRMKHCYDFTDVLTRFNNLLETDPSVKENVQRYYEYVIADEVQDFTPLMWSILRQLVDNGTPLTVIGDEDQNIYRFRGADLHDILHFDTLFPNAQIFMLEQNRRCRAKILDVARSVIEENKLRFNKRLIGCKDGGEVRYVPYNTQEGQIISIINELKKMTQDELNDTVICYRNKEDSMLLTDVLEQEEITFNVISGSQPLTHELYRHVISVLDALEQPRNRLLALNLYKVLPCSRSALARVLGYDYEKRKFTEEDTHKHFAEYYYDDVGKIRGFADTMDRLIDVSSRFESMSTGELFHSIWDLLTRYFWKFKKEQNNNLDTDEIFEERVRRFFDSDLKYDKFFERYNRRLSVCRRNTELKAGLSVSTFHSLKGLEFSKVYAIYMDNEIFPNFSLIDARRYGEVISQELKEAETRLWYVAITRAKDSLTVYYNKENPSYYVQKALDLVTDTRLVDLNNDDLEFAYLCKSAGLVAGDAGTDSSVSVEMPVMNEFYDEFNEDCPAGDLGNAAVCNTGIATENKYDDSGCELEDLQSISAFGDSKTADSPNAMLQSLVQRLMK